MAQGITERQSETGRTDFNQEFPAEIGRDLDSLGLTWTHFGFTMGKGKGPDVRFA